MIPISVITHSCLSVSSSRNTASSEGRQHVGCLSRTKVKLGCYSSDFQRHTHKKKKTTQHTCHPGIEEDVHVPGAFLPGPADAIRCHHSNVHLVLPHNAVCCWGDGHGDHVVRGVCDAAFPSGLMLLCGEDRDVGALAELRAGA